MDDLAQQIRANVARLVGQTANGAGDANGLKDPIVLVATSGGPDSQALLSLLAALRPVVPMTLCAVGIDHGLR